MAVYIKSQEEMHLLGGDFTHEGKEEKEEEKSSLLAQHLCMRAFYDCASNTALTGMTFFINFPSHFLGLSIRSRTIFEPTTLQQRGQLPTTT